MPKDNKPKRFAKIRGSRLGFWFFEISLKLFGLRGAYTLLYGVALHYLLFDSEAVLGALSYIKRRFPSDKSFIKNRIHVYRLFVSQGKQLIDRFAILSNRNLFDIKLKGYDELAVLLSEKNKGFILK